ncbi:MAG: aspartate kinase [Acidobacteria bacterium]|nr:MAG: aspartate kinase [Acidobacteriota bacterium]
MTNQRDGAARTCSSPPGLSVLKFGGTSVKNIGRIQHVAGIVDSWRQSAPALVVVSAMGDTTDYLLKLARQCSSDPDRRELDLLMSTGEQISMALLAMVLRYAGIRAKSFTASQVGIFTETVHSSARIIDVKTDKILQAFADNEVVVVAGFQGVTADGDVTTLGRGGSDTTAVALAAAIGAPRCHIYTDVDGVYTADPNVIPEARLIKQISYEEVVEMSRLGARVIHPRAVELARRHEIALRIRNTFKPHHEGSLIDGGKDMEIHRAVSGVAIDTDHARVAIMDVPDRPGVAGKIVKALADRHIVIDMIMQAFHPTTGLSSITFTVHRSDLDQTIGILQQVKEELGAKEVLADTDVAKVSVIGAGLSGRPGIAAKLFATLGDDGINIKMIATSEMRLTCVVGTADAERAARLAHQAFDLDKAPSPDR